jgi:hypothetical protein
MDVKEERTLNQGAFQRSIHQLAQHYGKGRILAFSQGEVIADADSFREMQDLLKAMGKDSTRILLVQAGTDYPETAVIF